MLLAPGIEETGGPAIIYLVSPQVLRHPSEHETSSMGKHLHTTAHIAMSNELTESEVTKLMRSTVTETVFAMLKRYCNQGITIVWSQRKSIFVIQVDQYSQK